MPSYAIHLAAALKYLESHTENDIAAFLEGALAPDLLEKPASHYGPKSSAPGLELCIADRGLSDCFNRGYYFHLYTDMKFYNEFLPRFVSAFSREIYNDYDNIIRAIIDRYGVEIPDEIKDTVGFSEGEPKIIPLEALFEFIDSFKDETNIFY